MKPSDPLYRPSPDSSPALKNLAKLNKLAFLIAVGALVLMCLFLVAVVMYGR